MTDRIPIRELVLVEGKYDKIALSQVIDAVIMTTEGFGIFNSAARRALIKRIGEERGVILLTDSDGGGTQIRAYLSGILPRERIKHLYIPRIEGKEKRKRTASRSGVLGVEGMKPEVLRHLFEPLRADRQPREGREITAADLYARGLTGGEGASERRARLCAYLGIPPLSAKQLLAALNCLYTYEEFCALWEAQDSV